MGRAVSAQPAQGGSGWLELQLLFQGELQAALSPRQAQAPRVCSPAAPLQSHSQGGTSPCRAQGDISGLLNNSENPFNLEPGLWGVLIVNRNEKQFWDRIILFLTCNKMKSHYLNVSKI